MKQIFILVFLSEVDAFNFGAGFFDRKEIYQYEADNLNSDLIKTKWILQPNN